jgi:hypothetical protein
MKAQERHELQTNALADLIGRQVKGFAESGGPSSAWGWTVFVLVVVTVGIWMMARNAAVARAGAQWREFENEVHNPDGLRILAERTPGSVPGRAARFQRARLLVPDGLRTLCGPDRDGGVKRLVQGRNLYVELTRQSTDVPLLQQEALYWSAVAEEALVGVPNPDDAGKMLGSLDRALTRYKQLAADFPSSFLGQKARRRAEELEKDGPAIAKFYEHLSEYAVELANKSSSGGSSPSPQP